MAFLHLGGGMIVVPAYIYIFHLSEKEARATSIYSILPMVTVSGIIYFKGELIDWKLALYCAIGGIIGGIIGSVLLKKMSDKYLKLFFIFFLIYASVKLIFF